MRKPRRALAGRRGLVLAGVAGAGLWVASAVLLWRTSAPSLDLDGFDENRFFTQRQLSRAHDYERGLHVLWVLSTLAHLAALAVLARVLPRRVRGIGLGRIGTSVIVGMVVLVTTWAVSLPFGLVWLWWQHHWGLGPFDVREWLVAQRFALGATAAVAMATIALLVALAARLRRTWWIPGAAVFATLAVVVVLVSGWAAAAGTEPVRDAALQADIERLERAEGVSPPVRVEKIEWTSQANAFATGFGPSTHVVLWDTLLDGRFKRGEIEAAVAHELAHVKRMHVLKGIAWFALFAFPGLFVVAEVTRRRGGLRDPANLPLAVLVLALVTLVAAPFQNAISRRYEAEADWTALRMTRDPDSMRGLFRGFQRTSLQDPSPPVWAYLWLESHPTLMQRIAMAERYAEASGSP